MHHNPANRSVATAADTGQHWTHASRDTPPSPGTTPLHAARHRRASPVLLTTSTIASAATGLVAGPWLRGVVYAHSVEYGQPLRSQCTRCGRHIANTRWHALTAVAPLRGRCPACAARLGPPTGAVELLAATVLAILALRAPSAWVLAAWSWAALFGVALALIDAAVLRLPTTLTTVAFTGVIVLLAIAAVATRQPHPAIRAIAAAAGLGLLYLLAVLAPAGGMGPGDAKLATLIGACLGWLSIAAVVAATFGAVLLAAGYVIVMLAARRLHSRSEVPFGVFMLLGAFALLASGVATAH